MDQYGYNTAMLKARADLNVPKNCYLVFDDLSYKIHKKNLVRLKPSKQKKILKKLRKKARKASKIKKIQNFVKYVVNPKGLPKSEVWFRNLYEKHYKLIEDEYNVIYKNRYLPDVINHGLKYVIEVDGSIHDLDRIKDKDLKKDVYFAKNGFKVFRVEAYNNASYVRLMQDLFRFRLKESLPSVEFKNWCLTNDIEFDSIFTV